MLLTSGISLAQSVEEYKEVIEKNNSLMKEAMLNGNAHAGIQFYAEDAISMPNQSPMVEGIDAILKNNEMMLSSEWKVKDFITNIQRIIPSGKMITEIGTFKMIITGPGMEAPFEEVGKYVTIWEDQGNMDLKIKVEIWNSDSNPAEQK
jgi:ketosteroid isomerase-like protein